MLLEGRVAVVSGLGPGMGRDISLALAGAGADLVLGARTPSALEAVGEEVEALGRRVRSVPTDITDPDQCRRLVEAAAGLGRVDVLVNNAFAEEDWHRFDGFDVERWHLPFEVNVFGTLQLSQAAIPHMKAAGGSIVMITTLSIHMVNPVLGGYAASKRSLTSAAQAMAREARPVRDQGQLRGARPHLGPVAGALLRVPRRAPRHHGPGGLRRDRGHDRVEPHRHVGGDPRVVLFFASDLSRVITGQTLDVNCGRTMT